MEFSSILGTTELHIWAFPDAFLVRSSAVYGVFLFIGTFTLAALQAHAPNLALLSIFSMIVLDVVSDNLNGCCTRLTPSRFVQQGPVSRDHVHIRCLSDVFS